MVKHLALETQVVLIRADHMTLNVRLDRSCDTE